eukprot:Platyproteum_vivax@DN7527_c0_g2_i3.p1
MVIWGIPGSLICLGPMYWMYRFGWMPAYAVLLVVGGHLSIWILLNLVIVPWLIKDSSLPAETPYSKMAATTPADYFNCNHVHVLRTRFVEKGAGPIVPYLVGKEYLQGEQFDNRPKKVEPADPKKAEGSDPKNTENSDSK